MTIDIKIHNNNFTLHPSGAMFWQERNMLLISDVHLGKATHFRKHGIAIPLNSVAGNFTQLSSVADYFQAEIICFLGDLFHSKLNNEWLLFENWVNSRPEKFILIVGNHDILAPEKYENIGMAIAKELLVKNFLFTHEPEDRDGHFTFCGHIHPGVSLRGFGRQILDLPCFFQTHNQIILPAFGEFTGKYILEPSLNDLIYAITKEAVISVNVRERQRKG